MAAKKKSITSCLVPEEVPEAEAVLFRKLHRAFCDQKDTPGHECRGALWITARSVTVRCALCGDARRKIPAEASDNDTNET